MNPSRTAKAANSANGSGHGSRTLMSGLERIRRRSLRRLNRLRHWIPAPGAEKDVADLAGHVEGREQCADRAQIKRHPRDVPLISGMQDRIFAPKPGEE